MIAWIFILVVWCFGLFYLLYGCAKDLLTLEREHKEAKERIEYLEKQNTATCVEKNATIKRLMSDLHEALEEAENVRQQAENEKRDDRIAYLAAVHRSINVLRDWESTEVESTEAEPAQGNE